MTTNIAHLTVKNRYVKLCSLESNSQYVFVQYNCAFWIMFSLTIVDVQKNLMQFLSG